MTEEPDRPLRYREPRQARSAATLARVLQAAEEIAASSGLEGMTISGVAERAGVSVGTIYRRFDDKEQLITALTERMLERREEYVAERLCAADPSLPGVMDAYALALLESFADNNLFPELLRLRGVRHWTAAPAPSPKSTAACSKRQPPMPPTSGAPTRRRHWTPWPAPSSAPASTTPYAPIPSPARRPCAGTPTNSATWRSPTSSLLTAAAPTVPEARPSARGFAGPGES
ncbi:TetR/AcrR family transcriptional regulator [Streptomyces sp. RKAG290]|uniref:TetR/AcrR family transcriptional regulator n=1 Tax=Streptomyces sp. RKAG290 TaxID=2888348 RepID=UPI002033C969|nr:TetR/AcrR family transcriptional regulator [Streptomyces sp. RKAG290]MCM2416489.1 TetR family transcriptional regulator [Streptomyces sp. RKAG290]